MRTRTVSEPQAERSRLRRRRRPRPVSRRDDGNVDTGDGGDPKEKEALQLLDEAQTLLGKRQVERILDERQKDGPPPPEGADTCGGADDFSTAVSDNGDDAEADDVAAAGGQEGVASPQHAARSRQKKTPPMTDDDLAEAHADVFGRPLPAVARTEERLLALQIEVEKLPKADRKALTKALRKHPLLFVNCPHTKVMLEQDEEEEDFDAASVARRLAKYWECRRSLLGDRDCYAPGNFPSEPVLVDYQQFYKRTRAVLDDPRTDEMARQDAERMLKIIHKRKIEGLDKKLKEMEEDSIHEFNPEEHDDETAGEAVLELYARDMATESPDELKLQFLRVEKMHETKAANRLFQYWKMGLHLFGPALRQSKRATLDDLEDISELLFRCNMFRLMPEEDAFGRSIIVFLPILSPDVQDNSGDQMSAEQLSDIGINEDQTIPAKLLWYVIHAAMERECCQQNGFLVVADRRIVEDGFKKRRRQREACVNVMNCVPVKIRAVHVLVGPDPPWWKQQVLRGLNCVFRFAYRQRLVIHAGRMEEILAKLGGDFGIGGEKLPVDLGGLVEADYFSHWLEERMDAGL